MVIMVKSDEAIEDLLKGRLKVIQKKGGYRFSVDAVLLACFTRVKKSDIIADLGTGCGVIPLMLSLRAMEGRICGIELDAGAADMAKRSISLNGLSEKIDICQGDVRTIRELYTAETFDLVVTNPPFSLFREFVSQLVNYDKKFLIIGNVNAITYKEIFKIINTLGKALSLF